MEEKIKQKYPTLHKHLFTPTKFAKYLAMFLLILFPFVGFYLGTKYQSNLITGPSTQEIQKALNSSASKELPTLTPTLTPTPILTNSDKFTNWKTYINEGFLYSVDFPQEFELNQNNGKNSLIIERKINTPSGPAQNFIFISVIPVNPTENTEQAYNWGEETPVLLAMNVGETKVIDKFTQQSYQRLPDINFDNTVAKAYLSNNPWEFLPGTKEYKYYLQKGKYKYLIGGYVEEKNPFEDYVSETLFQQILSTFKFTGQVSNSINLTEKDNNGRTNASINDLITITLPNPGDGGYQFAQPTYDKKILLKISSSHILNTSNLLGDFGKDTWTFKTIASGNTRIKFSIFRSFNPSNPQTPYTFNIYVK